MQPFPFSESMNTQKLNGQQIFFGAKEEKNKKLNSAGLKTESGVKYYSQNPTNA